MFTQKDFISYKNLLLGICCLCAIACKNVAKEEEPSDSELTETSSTHFQAVSENVVQFNNPTQSNSSLPRLFSNDNELYMSWVEKRDSVATLYFSKYFNQNWQKRDSVISGADWFVNWADFPAIAVNNGAILTNILQKSDSGTYTYDIKLNLYSPYSKSWKKDFILHNDGTKSEHGFVSIIPYKDQSFYVTWLDGRNTIGGHGKGAMTLRNALVDSKGNIINDKVLDERVCDCCNTAMAMTKYGPVVAYRDRSDTEIRDISIVRLRNGMWSKPQTIGKDNWKIQGCPVNGPAIDAKDELVALTWFTAVNDEGDIQVSFSGDSGNTFGHSYRIDAGNATGRVDIVLIDNERAAVLWMEPSGQDELIWIMEINKNGNTQPPIIIAKTEAGRASGFPQMEKLGDDLIFAWTLSSAKGDKEILTASIKIDSFSKNRNSHSSKAHSVSH